MFRLYFVVVDYIFSDPGDAERKEIWRKMLQDCHHALLVLRQRDQYSDDDIQEFQNKIDDFYTAYLETPRAGKEGITYYIHMLGCLHISNYMKNHKILCNYSQQV